MHNFGSPSTKFFEGKKILELTGRGWNFETNDCDCASPFFICQHCHGLKGIPISGEGALIGLPQKGETQ